MSTILVAMVTAAVTAGAPAIAHGVHAAFAHNADKVDGKHAVGSSASTAARKGKLVATSQSTGRLPNNIIAKAPNAAKLDGRPIGSVAGNVKSTNAIVTNNLGTTPGTWGGPEVTVASMDFAVPGTVAQGVMVKGHLSLNDDMGPVSGCPCEFEVILRDGGTTVGAWRDTFYGFDAEISDWTMTNSFTAIAAAGNHTWTLAARVYDREGTVTTSFSVNGVGLTVQTIPFHY